MRNKKLIVHDVYDKLIFKMEENINYIIPENTREIISVIPNHLYSDGKRVNVNSLEIRLSNLMITFTVESGFLAESLPKGLTNIKSFRVEHLEPIGEERCSSKFCKSYLHITTKGTKGKYIETSCIWAKYGYFSYDISFNVTLTNVGKISFSESHLTYEN